MNGNSNNKKLTDVEADSAFAEMASDEAYQEDAVRLARDFQKSDWDAYKADLGRSKDNEASGKLDEGS